MKTEDIVTAWRLEHKDELNKTLEVLISIRDNLDEKSKDRIDAGRSIARMLGALAPEKEGEAKKKAPEMPKMKDELTAGLEEVLGRIQ
jgi:hypothetical protein